MEDETTTRMVNLRRRMDRDNRHLACLVVIRGPALGERFPLSKERMTIGRKRDAEICVDDDSVSRSHAEVVKKGSDFILCDLGSKNGTYCNDLAVKEQALCEGDLLRVGEVVLKYLGPNSVEYLYLNKIADQARKDGLTGLFNKQTFQIYLERNLLRCRDLQEPLSLLTMDLDYFKKINDTWGHAAGDFVLKEFADLASKMIRPTDLLARVGGEEFCLILPHTNLKEGEVVGERIRSRIAEHRFTFDGHPLPVTVSIGITERIDPGEEAAPLLARSDKALYQAKKQGRNRICASSEIVG